MSKDSYHQSISLFPFSSLYHVYVGPRGLFIVFNFKIPLLNMNMTPVSQSDCFCHLIFPIHADNANWISAVIMALIEKLKVLNIKSKF